MLELNINEIKAHISETPAKVVAGETVVICEGNKPIAEIKPIKEQVKSLKEREVGLAKKKYPNFKLPKNFNEPLPDDILKYFVEDE